jgi:hypothetical protein
MKVLTTPLGSLRKPEKETIGHADHMDGPGIWMVGA